jgi:hypothetical protein
MESKSFSAALPSQIAVNILQNVSNHIEKTLPQPQQQSNKPQKTTQHQKQTHYKPHKKSPHKKNPQQQPKENVISNHIKLIRLLKA